MALLPLEIYLSLKDTSPERYMSFTGPERFLRFGPDEGIFADTVLFYADKAENGLVHIRSAYNNLYWVREIESEELLSVSALKPVEDSTKAGCTLFRPNVYSNNCVSFQHVRSQLNVVVQKTDPYYLTVANAAPSEFLFFKYTENLMKIPKYISFRGDNGMRLTARTVNNRPYLQFLELDNEAATVFETFVTRTGGFRFKSLTFGKLWRAEGSKWVMVDYADEAYNDPNNPDTVFEVCYAASGSKEGIALFCRGTNNYCKRMDEGGLKSCLAVGAISNRDQYAVLEPIDPSNSTINITSFRQEYLKELTSQILMDRQEIKNDTKVDKEVVLNQDYNHVQSLQFSNSVKIYMPTRGSKTFISRVPFVNDHGQLEIPDEVRTLYNLSWRVHDYTPVVKEAHVKVVVPAMTKLIVRLIGRKMLCEVPFSYTETNQFATLNLHDGVFIGNYMYTVEAEVIESQPL